MMKIYAKGRGMEKGIKDLTLEKGSGKMLEMSKLSVMRKDWVSIRYI
jgi:hypothetical protein